MHLSLLTEIRHAGWWGIACFGLGFAAAFAVWTGRERGAIALFAAMLGLVVIAWEQGLVEILAVADERYGYRAQAGVSARLAGLSSALSLAVWPAMIAAMIRGLRRPWQLRADLLVLVPMLGLLALDARSTLDVCVAAHFAAWHRAAFYLPAAVALLGGQDRERGTNAVTWAMLVVVGELSARTLGAFTAFCDPGPTFEQQAAINLEALGVSALTQVVLVGMVAAALVPAFVRCRTWLWPFVVGIVAATSLMDFGRLQPILRFQPADPEARDISAPP